MAEKKSARKGAKKATPKAESSTVIRKIKATDDGPIEAVTSVENDAIEVADTSETKKAKKSVKPNKKTKKVKDPNKKSRVPRPLRAIGGYFVGSWKELKKVVWPNRRTTWKMTAAVLLFSAFFAILILCADWVFNWLMKEVIL